MNCFEIFRRIEITAGQLNFIERATWRNWVSFEILFGKSFYDVDSFLFSSSVFGIEKSGNLETLQSLFKPVFVQKIVSFLVVDFSDFRIFFGVSW